MRLTKNEMRQALRLYAVTDRRWLPTAHSLREVVASVLDSGATMLQIREKELDDAIFLDEIRTLQELCTKKGVPCSVNDRVELAIRAGADGVHVGQSDIMGRDIRAMIGPDRILGITAKTVAQARAAETSGAVSYTHLDGEVLSGESLLDTAALTGESVPRSVGPGDAVISGCTNGAGVLRVRTTKCYEDSTVARILELVETAGERKAHLESFITRFARWYTPVVTLGAVLLALFPPLLLQASFAEWIHRACIFLIVSCPCALVISVPLGFFGGIGAASRLGVLVKGANFLEAAAELDTLVFDKTGTLTEGTFRLSGIYPAAASGYTEAELLRLAAIVESRSTHPIAQSICAAYRDVQSRLAAVQETESLEAAAGAALPAPEELQEIAGMGISARCDGRELLLGSAQLMEKRGIRFQRRTEIGTAVYLACDGQFIGSIVIADAVKPGAEEAISALRKLGVRRCVMLSGDRRESAEAAAAKLGMDEVYSELLPEDKVQRVEALLRGGMASEGATEQEIAVSGQKPGQRRGTAEKERQSHGRLGFVGDGINDAPVLMRADVGIAMGSLGSDAAIEAADIVIMDDDIGKLAGIIRISRRTLRIVRQNVFFALLVKAAVLFFGALGMANMWEAVFGDVGVTVLAVLNSMRALKVER